jgi:hypothetical protein
LYSQYKIGDLVTISNPDLDYNPLDKDKIVRVADVESDGIYVSVREMDELKLAVDFYRFDEIELVFTT